jgi:hypothetical protein
VSRNKLITDGRRTASSGAGGGRRHAEDEEGRTEDEQRSHDAAEAPTADDRCESKLRTD